MTLSTQTIYSELAEQMAPSVDIMNKSIMSSKGSLDLLYYKTLTDEEKVQSLIIKPFFEMEDSKNFAHYLNSHPKVIAFTNQEHALEQLMNGSILMKLEDSLFMMELKKVVNNAISDATVETTILGPDFALSESIETNLNLIRNRYPNSSLKIENFKVGAISKTKVNMLYDKQFVNNGVLKEVTDLIKNLKIDVFQSGEQLIDLERKWNRSLIPTIFITERPDRIVHNLAEGKVVLLVEGSPFAVIMPTVFYDFMSTMADIYQPYWIGRFLIILRYIGLLICIILPAFYVAVTSYNPEIFRVQLALSIAGSRGSVPYPSYVEVLFMLLMMELLTEASIRLPKSIGPTATTVGGLILGQAATEAGLVSNIMIIIVSAVAISNFVIPITTMNFAIRTLKYFLLLLASLYGIIGVACGFFFLIAYIVNHDSFGEPFLKLFVSKPSKSRSIMET